MNPESENPGPLREILREWRITEPLPARFREGVWQRIQHSEARTTPVATTTGWRLWQTWLAAFSPRPAMAVAYLSILLVAGIVGGYKRARQAASRWDNELGTRYVQTVDPYQKPPRF